MKALYATLILAAAICRAEDAPGSTPDASNGQDMAAASTAKSHEVTMTGSIGKFLNIAILRLPPKYCGGIPIANRIALLRQLSDNPHDDRLDYAKGYLHYTSDNAEENAAIGGNCRFHIKLLPTDDNWPRVFVFMDRNYSGTDTPSAKDATILAGGWGEWDDITRSVLPPGVERNRYILPSRDSLDFEVRKREIRTTDTGGRYYCEGALEAVIRWNGRRFVKVPLTEQAGTGQQAPVQAKEETNRHHRPVIWAMSDDADLHGYGEEWAAIERTGFRSTDYKALLLEVANGSEIALAKLFEVSAATKWDGCAGEAHLATMQKVLLRWGDLGFSKVLKKQDSSLRSHVRRVIDVNDDALHLFFPMTCSIFNESKKATP